MAGKRQRRRGKIEDSIDVIGIFTLYKIDAIDACSSFTSYMYGVKR